MGFPDSSVGKESVCNAGNLGSIPGLGRFPWRRERLPTPVFWPGEFHELYIPWGHKESDMTERLSLHFALSYIHPHIISLYIHLSFLPPTHPSSLCFIYLFILGCAGSWLLSSFVVVNRLLILAPSLVGQHGLQGMQASVVVAHGLGWPIACGTFPDQGLNPCPLHWQVDPQPPGPPGKPWLVFLMHFKVGCRHQHAYH